MIEVSINYLAVLVATIVGWGLGAVWYSPMMFGKQWMQLSGLTTESVKSMKMTPTMAYIGQLVATFIMAYVLAHIVQYAGGIGFVAGMEGGFWVWLGFIATTMAGSFLFEGKPVKLFLINAGYYLVALLLMGGILASWL